MSAHIFRWRMKNLMTPVGVINLPEAQEEVPRGCLLF